MSMKTFGSLLAVSLALVAQGSSASTYIPCDNCLYSQQAALAISHGVGRYVVGNVLANNVNAFRVYSSPTQNGIGSSTVNPNTNHLYSDDGQITATEKAAFSHLVAFYNTAPVGYQKQYNLQIVGVGASLNVPLTSKPGATGFNPNPNVTAPGVGLVKYPNPNANAYGVINGGPNQNAFLNWVGSQPTLGINGAVSNLVATTILKATGISPWAIGINVQFMDGSHIGVYVDMTQTPAALLVNPASAIDSHGNNIPASLKAVTGAGRQQYGFSGNGNSTDQPNMHNQIGSFGIAVPATPQYACVSTPDGTHCVSVQ